MNNEKKLYNSYNNHLARKKEVRLKKKIYNKIIELTSEHESVKTSYLSILDYYKNRFVERIFAYKKDRNRSKKNPEPKIFYKEVIRIIEGCNIIHVKEMYYTRMSGYRTAWENSNNGYYSYVLDNKFYFEDSSYYQVPVKQLFNLEDAIKLNDSIKYCGYIPSYIYSGAFVSYISRYKEYPQIEMLSKFNIQRLITDTRCLNRMAKEKEFFKYLAKHRFTIKDMYANYNDILNAYKMDLDLKYYLDKKLFLANNIYLQNKEALENKLENILKYLIKVNSSVSTYLDYYHAAKRFIDMKDSKHLYPKDLIYWHDYYTKKLQETLKKELLEKYKNVVKKYKYLNYSNNIYIIFISENPTDLIKEGKALNHCVGGYTNKVVEEESLILFLRNKDDVNQPFYTIELSLSDYSIIQIQGYKHCKPTNEINNFVHEWEYKKLNTFKMVA